MPDEDETEVGCPYCGETFDAFTLYEHNSGRASRCPNCSERVSDDEWVTD